MLLCKDNGARGPPPVFWDGCGIDSASYSFPPPHLLHSLLDQALAALLPSLPPPFLRPSNLKGGNPSVSIVQKHACISAAHVWYPRSQSVWREMQVFLLRCLTLQWSFSLIFFCLQIAIQSQNQQVSQAAFQSETVACTSLERAWAKIFDSLDCSAFEAKEAVKYLKIGRMSI